MACLEPVAPGVGLVAAEPVAVGCVAGMDRGDLLEGVAFAGQALVVVVEVGLPGPGRPQVAEDLLERSGGLLGAVALDVLGGLLGGGGGAEVGPVPGEHLLPLAPGVVDVVGDQVGDVVVPAAGHRDVGRGGGGVLAQHQVPGAGGLALGAVDGGGVGQLDVLRA